MQLSKPAGYLAVPETDMGPGILVLHAWWGLNETAKQICDRLAGEGFIAFAPDLYNGKLASTIAEAEVLSGQVDQVEAMSIIAQAADLLWERVRANSQQLGVIGFSLGAYFALKLSAEDPDRIGAVVLFYGTGYADFAQAGASFQGHFADNDPYEPRQGVDQLEASLKESGYPVSFYHYEGVGHWFFEHDQVEAYDEPAAVLAWDRAIQFFRKELQSVPD